MHNPDQHYEAHILHLKDLYEQAEHNRMITALTQHRLARVHAAGRRLGVLLVTLGTWLARSAQRDEQPAQHGVARDRGDRVSAGCCDRRPAPGRCVG
jgi:hypothetical protein